MLRTASHVAVSIALLALAVGAAAREPAGKVTGPIRAKSILGAKVSITGGTSVGVVDDVILTDEGVVDYVVVSQSGKLVTVPWEAVRFDHGKRAATIDITRERYEKIPTYTTERYPEFYTPEYRTEIYRYYNLKPGQGRRLERRER